MTGDKPNPRSLGYEEFPKGVSSGRGALSETYKLDPHPFLSGKTALVTGGAIGVGRGVSLELARRGVTVGIHFYNEVESAEQTARLIKDIGGKAALFKADFSAADGTSLLTEEALRSFSKIDILVNNAGITANAPFFEVTPGFFDRLVNVNLRSMYFLTQSIAAHMKQLGGGTIINLSSLHADFAMNEHSVYAMTKAAVKAFTRNTALELAPHGIRMNAIAPGWCFGENHLRLLGNESRSEAAANIPAGYISNPITVGRLATQLCLPELDYFLGQTLVFDGGMSAVMANTPRFSTPLKERWGSWYIEE